MSSPFHPYLYGQNPHSYSFSPRLSHLIHHMPLPPLCLPYWLQHDVSKAQRWPCCSSDQTPTTQRKTNTNSFLWNIELFLICRLLIFPASPHSLPTYISYLWPLITFHIYHVLLPLKIPWHGIFLPSFYPINTFSSCRIIHLNVTFLYN